MIPCYKKMFENFPKPKQSKELQDAFNISPSRFFDKLENPMPQVFKDAATLYNSIDDPAEFMYDAEILTEIADHFGIVRNDMNANWFKGAGPEFTITAADRALYHLDKACADLPHEEKVQLAQIHLEDSFREFLNELSERKLITKEERDALDDYVMLYEADENYYEEDYDKQCQILETAHLDEKVFDDAIQEEDLDEIEDIPKEESYEYWRENIMDERLEYLDSDEKYEMYLHWKNNKEEPEEEEDLTIEKEEERDDI